LRVFDPIAEVADLAAEYGAWLHVDGAFGLFARASPLTKTLARGVERANSVIADGHKWLNVPFDCGFALVRERRCLADTFGIAREAAYLPEIHEERLAPAELGPEMSRRARALPVWATLAAYGRSGHRALVERNLDYAQRLAERVRASEDFELLADVPLNIVCFRYRPAGLAEDELDDLNLRLARRCSRTAASTSVRPAGPGEWPSVPRLSTGAAPQPTSTCSSTYSPSWANGFACLADQPGPHSPQSVGHSRLHADIARRSRLRGHLGAGGAPRRIGPVR
jgi:glutamate/tyrosine decarboxylase-like PLP-dependent enzyme